jgi:hypothetical protein
MRQPDWGTFCQKVLVVHQQTLWFLVAVEHTRAFLPPPCHTHIHASQRHLHGGYAWSFEALHTV